ncbi:MBL fold metallo-hydrolase [Methanobacterium sp. ACI-7]|uniref:MBL fold metallo-hydrolase n=1 Tax=unclassified Methanobacterium TaxID=2627676 RepID=UPI0039C2D43A
MKIIPLAFESMGVRSMATYVETDQKILIDPGTSIAPKRFGYPPWKDEFEALYETRAKINECAKIADIITISHYHHDHYTPFELGKFLDSSPETAEKMYRNKRLFIKHPTSEINKSQRKRVADFLKNLDDLECEISYTDGQTFDIGNTVLKFSNALPHGPEGGRLGFVVALTIEYDGKSLMHASDVQGPISDKTKQFILDENPDILILSGPPIYLQDFVMDRSEIQKARKNLIEIAENIPKVVVDHHLLRDLRSFKFIKSIKEESKGNICVASEILDKKPYLLEARRKKFYRSK